MCWAVLPKLQAPASLLPLHRPSAADSVLFDVREVCHRHLPSCCKHGLILRLLRPVCQKASGGTVASALRALTAGGSARAYGDGTQMVTLNSSIKLIIK